MAPDTSVGMTRVLLAGAAAVKCNPNCEVVRVLAKAPGCGFDCASPAEMDLVLNCGVDPSRIIYANPCKDMAALEHALDGERNPAVLAPTLCSTLLWYIQCTPPTDTVHMPARTTCIGSTTVLHLAFSAIGKMRHC